MSFLRDGYRTVISIAAAASIPANAFGAMPAGFVLLKEKEVQEPEADVGGPIDQTSMRNTGWRTASPKSLVTMGEMTLQCEYDPRAEYIIINYLIGVNTIMTVIYPDRSAAAFWGWVDKFTPASKKEGELPLAEVKIIPSMVDSNFDQRGIAFDAGPVAIPPVPALVPPAVTLTAPAFL